MVSDIVTVELKKLLRQSGHYLAGLLGGLALGFVSFPIFTRVFSVADYGLIDYVQKIVLLLTAGAKLGLQNSALRFYDGPEFVRDREAARRYYSTLFYSTAAVASAVTAIFLAAMWLAPGWLIEAPLANLLCFAATLIVLRAVESILWAFLRVEERTKAYSAANVAMKAGTIAIVLMLLISWPHSPRAYFAGAIAAETLTVSLLTVWICRRGLIIAAKFDWKLFRISAGFGTPLVAYELSSVALITADRFLVWHYLGAQALGLYSVAFGLSSYLNDILVAPLNLALVPIYLRLWSMEGPQRTAEFLSVGLDLFLMVAAGMLALASVLSRDGVILLASSKYTGSEQLVPMLVASLLLYTTYVFLTAGLLIQNRTFTMAKLLFCSAAANIGLNVLLLPRLGLKAAALAALLSYALCILMLGVASSKTLPLRLNVPALAKYAAAAWIAWAVASWIEFGMPLSNLIARGGSALTLYGGLLYLLDGRVRSAVARAKWRAAGPGPLAEVSNEVEHLGVN